MTPFHGLHSVAAPMPGTDIIFPARFLLLTEKAGLGRYAFHDKRFDAEGRERDDFVLLQPAWRQAGILVAGPNFGCGSSREQAPWALADLGIRCIVAPGFGKIFRANCYANGLLPIVLGSRDHARVMREALATRPMTIDLMGCRIELNPQTADRRSPLAASADGEPAAVVGPAGYGAGFGIGLGFGIEIHQDDPDGDDATGEVIVFEVPQRQRDALLAGLDEIGLIQRHEASRIADFERRQRAHRPWLFTADAVPIGALARSSSEPSGTI